MNRCVILLSAVLVPAAAARAPAQEPSPFAPPATLMAPVPAPPAERIFTAPPLGPAPAYDRLGLRDPESGPLLGMQINIIRPQLGGYLAGGSLNTTVAPSFLLGWRFPSGRSLQFEYLYFGANSDRTVQFPGDPAPSVNHLHIEGHVFDLDVRFREGGWSLLRSQWEIGLRAANISYFAFQPSPNFTSLVVNRFDGAGPHFDYKLSVAVFDTGLEFFARSDLGVLWGTNRGFSQVPDPPGIGPRVDWSHTGDGHTLWTGRWQLGASYWFCWRNRKVLIAGGYEYDGYLFPSAGERVTSGGGFFFPFRYEPGHVTLTNQGAFLRAEMKY